MWYSYGSTELTSTSELHKNVNQLNSPLPDNQQRKFYWGLKQTKDTLRCPPSLCPPSLHTVGSLHIPTLHKTLVSASVSPRDVSSKQVVSSLNQPLWVILLKDGKNRFFLTLECANFLPLNYNNFCLGFTTYTSMTEAGSSCLKGMLTPYHSVLASKGRGEDKQCCLHGISEWKRLLGKRGIIREFSIHLTDFHRSTCQGTGGTGWGAEIRARYSQPAVRDSSCRGLHQTFCTSVPTHVGASFSRWQTGTKDCVAFFWNQFKERQTAQTE